MELTEVLSISGKPGLYRMLSSNGSRLIVESITDGKKMPVSATAKISSLGDIAIFTVEEDVPLADVFEKMHEKTGGSAAPNHKSDPKVLRSYIDELLDDLDHGRVYDSDLKKLFQWFNILLANGFFDQDEAEASDDSAEEAPAETLEAEASDDSAEEAPTETLEAEASDATTAESTESTDAASEENETSEEEKKTDGDS